MTIDPTAFEPLMQQAAATPAPASEQTVFETTFAGPALDSCWKWNREDDQAWRFANDGSGIELVTKPGGLWGSTFAALPPPTLLLQPLGDANACEVTVTMPSARGKFGEQAGLFWYFDDNNYAKLVVEWMEDGSASVVLGQECEGKPAVVSSASLDEDQVSEPIRLRLERSSNGSELSGVIVGAYYMRLVGSCSTSGWENQSKEASIGISAHGGEAESFEQGRSAHFTKFSAIAIQSNRVQWGGAPGRAEPRAAPPQDESFAPPAPGAGLTAASGGADLSGWTLSSSLSEEDRNRVAELLGANGLMPPGDNSNPGADDEAQ
eukprot:TRINITY_DN8922_c1_g1_i1.p1 TRINITY_DN8922_c1_g1~~TRINITY_DN8922_c1_g1_i1.p1  ORF type:complete len:321 (+),score=82.96 TRINITY_DN8922_c1_g1_i1:3-965(+)